MISSSLEEELKCLVLYDVEMEARESATRSSVLSQKRYNNLANFSWDSVVFHDQTQIVTFLTRMGNCRRQSQDLTFKD